MAGGAWSAAVHGVSKSQTWLNDFTFTFHFHALEKEMAAHSSVLAWRIPGRGEPGGLPSMGSHRVGHDWSDLAAAAAAAVFSLPSTWQPLIYFLSLLTGLFWTLNINGIIQYVAFYSLLLLLRIMLLIFMLLCESVFHFSWIALFFPWPHHTACGRSPTRVWTWATVGTVLNPDQ